MYLATDLWFCWSVQCSQYLVAMWLNSQGLELWPSSPWQRWQHIDGERMPKWDFVFFLFFFSFPIATWYRNMWSARCLGHTSFGDYLLQMNFCFFPSSFSLWDKDSKISRHCSAVQRWKGPWCVKQYSYVTLIPSISRVPLWVLLAYTFLACLIKLETLLSRHL